MATDLLTADPTTASSRSSARIGAGDSALVSSISREGQGSAVGAPAGDAASTRSLTAVLADYVQLTKPRIVVMILVTTVSTAMIGAGGLVPTVDLIWLLLATGAVAGSAGAANQIWERIIDARMTRTSKRPLPAGRLNAIPASIFTGLLGIAGSLLLLWMFNATASVVGVVTWLMYVLIYTPMKTRSAWNTTVGAIAGAPSRSDRLHRTRRQPYRQQWMVVGRCVGRVAVPTLHGDRLDVSPPIQRGWILHVNDGPIPAVAAPVGKASPARLP